MNAHVARKRFGQHFLTDSSVIAAIVRGLDPAVVVEGSANSKSKKEKERERDREKGEVLIAHKDIVVETGDHVIVFCMTKKVVTRVEKLFAVGLHFF